MPQKVRIARMAGVLLAAASCGAARAHDSQIEQITGNHSVITQTGTGNAATLEQQAILGRFGANMSTITQSGADNSADVAQKGTRNSANVEQYGNNNAAQVGQYGLGLKADVTQTGNGLGITVNQYGIGGLTSSPVIIRQH